MTPLRTAVEKMPRQRLLTCERVFSFIFFTITLRSKSSHASTVVKVSMGVVSSSGFDVELPIGFITACG
jgi:hypothetical protein